MSAEVAFREAVLAHTFEHAPRLVWADWLDKRGDVRGAWLRHWCALEDAALAVPPDPAGGGPDAGRPTPWQRLRVALAAYPGDRRLLAVSLTGAVPAGPARLRDLLRDHPGRDTAHAAAAAAIGGLVACGLVAPAALAGVRGCVWSARAVGSGFTGWVAQEAARALAAAADRPEDPEAEWAEVIGIRGSGLSNMHMLVTFPPPARGRTSPDWMERLTGQT